MRKDKVQVHVFFGKDEVDYASYPTSFFKIEDAIKLAHPEGYIKYKGIMYRDRKDQSKLSKEL